jgi:hypothetical protein
MELSCELLLSILSGLRSGLGSSAGKRKNPRVGLTARISLLGPSGKTQIMSKRVSDISSSGVGLLSTIRIEQGRVLPLVLATPEGEPRIMSCRVLYCREIEPGKFKLGCKFVDDPWKVLHDIAIPAAHS